MNCTIAVDRKLFRDGNQLFGMTTIDDALIRGLYLTICRLQEARATLGKT
jgi:hypothetical protein